MGCGSFANAKRGGIVLTSIRFTVFEIVEPKTVTLVSSELCESVQRRLRSAESPRARSARKPASGSTRASPVASVSSVTGAGAKKPLPTDNRNHHGELLPPGRHNIASRGLKNLPYWLWWSTRPLAESVRLSLTS